MSLNGSDLPTSISQALTTKGLTFVGAHAGLHVYVNARGDRVVTLRRVGDDVVELHADGRYAASWRVDAEQGRAARSLGEAVDGARWLVVHDGLRQLERIAASVFESLGLVRIAAVHEVFIDMLRFERAEFARVVICDVIWDHHAQRIEVVVAEGVGTVPFPAVAVSGGEGVKVRWCRSEERVMKVPFEAWVREMLVGAVEHLRME